MFALLLSISAAVAVAKGTWNSPDYSFEKYMGEYGLKFEGAELEVSCLSDSILIVKDKIHRTSNVKHLKFFRNVEECLKPS